MIGDSNAKVGSEAFGNVVENSGLGDSNSRGDRLVKFCTEQQLFVVNKFFKLPLHLYAWNFVDTDYNATIQTRSPSEANKMHDYREAKIRQIKREVVQNFENRMQNILSNPIDEEKWMTMRTGHLKTQRILVFEHR